MKGSAKSPLLNFLLGLLKETRHVDKERYDESRKQFLKTGLVLSAGLSVGLNPDWAFASNLLSPRVAIIGAGLAGLSCAWELKKKGITAQLFEADRQPGGRVKTLNQWPSDNQWVELGAEFINTDHKAIINLCKEFSIPLNDRQELSVAEEQETLVVVVNKIRYSTNQLKDALKNLASVALKDYSKALQQPTLFQQLDYQSLTEYLEVLDLEPWFRQVLETAFTSEFGINADEQTCINLIELIGSAGKDNEALFGNSDERYSIQGGNSQLINALVEKLTGQITSNVPLMAITPLSNGYQLDFAHRKPAVFDFVVLAVPLSQLSKIDLSKIKLPAIQREAFREMGYGKNNKLILGFNEAFWTRSLIPSIGTAIHDQLNNTWHSTPFQEGSSAALTAFLGGSNSLKLADNFNGIPSDTETEAMKFYLDELELAFPGAIEHYSSRWQTALWTKHPRQQGSYACYKPGQISRYRNVLAKPAGQIYFAGEYASEEYQGYMNGAVDSGQNAARQLLQRLKTRRTPSAKPVGKR